MGELLRKHMNQLTQASTDYRTALNVLIKYEIQCLLERLSSTGEEAVVITTSIDDGCPGFLGSVKGEKFIEDNKTLILLHSQLIDYCKVDESPDEGSVSKQLHEDRLTSGHQGNNGNTADDDEDMPVLERVASSGPRLELNDDQAQAVPVRTEPSNIATAGLKPGTREGVGETCDPIDAARDMKPAVSLLKKQVEMLRNRAVKIKRERSVSPSESASKMRRLEFADQLKNLVPENPVNASQEPSIALVTPATCRTVNAGISTVNTTATSINDTCSILFQAYDKGQIRQGNLLLTPVTQGNMAQSSTSSVQVRPTFVSNQPGKPPLSLLSQIGIPVSQLMPTGQALLRSVSPQISQKRGETTSTMQASTSVRSNTLKTGPQSLLAPGQSLLKTSNLLTTSAHSSLSQVQAAMSQTQVKPAPQSLLVTSSPRFTSDPNQSAPVPQNADSSLIIPSQTLPTNKVPPPSNPALTKGQSLVGTVTTCYICRQEFFSYERLKAHMQEHTEKGEIQMKGQVVAKAFEKVSCGICGVECLKKDMDDHFKTHDLGDDVEENEAGSDDDEGHSQEVDDRVKEFSDNLVDATFMETINKIIADDRAAEDRKTPSSQVDDDDDYNDDDDEDNNDDEDYLMSKRSKGSETADSKSYCGICHQNYGAEGMAPHMQRHNNIADGRNVDQLYEVKETPYFDSDGNTLKNGFGKEWKGKTYKCTKCGYKADRASRMREHVRACYFEDPQYGCKYCGKVYKIKRNLVSHMKIHSEAESWSPCENTPMGKKVHVCPKCNYETPRPSRFREHLQTCCGSSDLYECEVCKKVFRLKRYLHKHMKQQHNFGDKYFCSFCGYTSPLKAEFLEHVKTCKDRPSCMYCSMTFQNNGDVVKHLEYKMCPNIPELKAPQEKLQEESSIGDSYSCKYCLKSFKSSSMESVHSHEKVCSSCPNVSKHRCKFCAMKFASNLDVIKHLESKECTGLTGSTADIKPKSSKYKCKFCFITLASNAEAIEHLLSGVCEISPRTTKGASETDSSDFEATSFHREGLRADRLSQRSLLPMTMSKIKSEDVKTTPKTSTSLLSDVQSIKTEKDEHCMETDTANQVPNISKLDGDAGTAKQLETGAQGDVKAEAGAAVSDDAEVRNRGEGEVRIKEEPIGLDISHIENMDPRYM